MDIPRHLQKLNTKPVNTALIYSVFTLLGLNYLLYSFFDLGGVRNLIRAAAAGLLLMLLALRLADGKLRRRQVLMLLLAAWQILSGGTNGLNIAFLLILTVTVAEYRGCRVATVVFRVMAVLAAVVVLSLLLGIEENEVYTVGNRTRHKLGFVNVNSASMFLFTLLTSYLLYRGRRVGLLDLAAVMAIEVVVFLFTDSRTPLLCLIIMIALYLVMPRIPQKLLRIFCRVGIALLFLTAYLWVLPAVNSPLVNKLLSLRPMYCDEYFRNQNAWYFLVGGTRVKELDNGYLLLMFNTGVIVYTGVYFLIQKAVENLCRRRAYLTLAYVIAMLACSILEGSALRPELLCAPLLWVLILEALPGQSPPSFLLEQAQIRLARYLEKGTDSEK